MGSRAESVPPMHPKMASALPHNSGGAAIPTSCTLWRKIASRSIRGVQISTLCRASFSRSYRCNSQIGYSCSGYSRALESILAFESTLSAEFATSAKVSRVYLRVHIFRRVLDVFRSSREYKLLNKNI